MGHGKHIVYLGLGSNLGEREAHIQLAITLIAEQIGTLRRQSALFYSQPWGFESTHAFVNAVVCVATNLSPMHLLQATQHIEQLLGKRQEHATERQEHATTYHDRPIDIDILLYDNLNIDESNLIIPHPLMHERPFVMEPLKEIW
jgi:2-amino-4-hydroxy-6-hydroxymethyldihydropteridine diphosphokinase